MPTSDDKGVQLADRRRQQAVRPIDPATLARLYDGPHPRPKLIGLPIDHRSGWREAGDVAAIALVLLTILYFAAEFARAYLAGNL